MMYEREALNAVSAYVICGWLVRTGLYGGAAKVAYGTAIAAVPQGIQELVGAEVHRAPSVWVQAGDTIVDPFGRTGHVLSGTYNTPSREDLDEAMMEVPDPLREELFELALELA